jgi:beta-galactosidase beta subunit
MNAYTIYQKYIAIHTYFSGNYDYFKYNGKIRSATVASFNKRRDRHFFEKLSRRLASSEVESFIVANEVATHGQYWLNDFETAEDTFLQYKGKLEAIEYHYKNELQALLQFAKENDYSFRDLFANETHPPLYKAYLSRIISSSTLVILNRLLLFFPYFKTLMKNTPWIEELEMLEKYDKFLPNWNLLKFRESTLSIAKEMKND